MTNGLRKRYAVAVVLGFTLLSITAYAQTNEGSIAGNVLDASGAAVPGAQVSAKGTETGATYNTTSSASGSYTIPNVRIGSYDVTVTSQGFQNYSVSNVQVQVATQSTVN